MKNKIAVITGGSGFIGSNLTRKLLEKKFDVHLLLRKNAKTWRLKDIMHDITIHEISLSDKKKLEKILKKINPQFIYHFSSYGNYSWQEDISEMIQTNIVELQNLLVSSKEINYTRLINTGTSSEYGFKNSPMNEDDLLAPDSFYGVTKASGTLLAGVFAKKYNKPVITFRLFSVYGPFEEPRRFIPTIINSSIKNKEIKITKQKSKRDFIFVEDVINAYIQASLTNLEPGTIINIGTGRQFDNYDILRIIKKINQNVKISKEFYPARTWDKYFWVADIKRARRLLNWRPEFSLDEGIRRTYEWFLMN